MSKLIQQEVNGKKATVAFLTEIGGELVESTDANANVMIAVYEDGGKEIFLLNSESRNLERGPIFDLSSLTEIQRSWIEEILEQSTFDWSLLELDEPVKIEFEELNPGMTTANPEFYYGLSSYEKPLIEIDSTIDKKEAVRAFMWEAAHLVDFYYMTPSQRSKIWNVYVKENNLEDPVWFYKSDTPSQDKYFKQIGESFMIGFTRAFSDIKTTDESYAAKSTPEVIKVIRETLGQKKSNV